MVKVTSVVCIMVICVMMISFIGCGSDDSSEDDIVNGNSSAPPLPPDESMMVDTSNFKQVAAPSQTIPAMKNYANAVTRVTIVSSALLTAITPPATLFVAAKTVEPIEQEDGSWLWSYMLPVENVTFNAKLTGTTKGNETFWSMKVSGNTLKGKVENFEWYKGVTNDSNTAGSWNFFDLTTPTEQNPTVSIDWEIVIKVLKKEGELTVKNVDERSGYFNDALDYKIDPINASMNYKDASTNEAWSIIWDVATGAGSITVPNYNGGKTAYWDENHLDVVAE